MSAPPRFPAPPAGYDYQNEAAFRRAIATYLAGLESQQAGTGGAGSSAWGDITGTPTTVAGYGITDAQEEIARAAVTVTTASLADDTEETGTVVLGKTGLIILVEADRACWVRLYGTAAERTADAARLITDDPTNDAPVLAELVFDAAHLAVPCAPLIGFTNRDGTPATTLYYSIINMSGSTSTVQVDFTRLILEN